MEISIELIIVMATGSALPVVFAFTQAEPIQSILCVDRC